MSLNLFLTPGTVPFGTALPGNAQALIDMVAQYEIVAGDSNIIGINYGPDTPAPENRGFPWWRTDSGYNPIGMFNWNGSAWVTVANTVSSGPTSSRPLAPATGTEYLDTTINTLLIYERGAWRTVSGSPGDVKSVKASTIEAAILQNPGWVQDPDSLGRTIIAAGAGTGLTTRNYLDKVGAEEVTLTLDQIAAHSHTDLKMEGSNQDNGDVGSLVITAATQDNGVQTILNSTTGPAGGDKAHSNMQPSVAYWMLVKQ